MTVGKRWMVYYLDYYYPSYKSICPHIMTATYHNIPYYLAGPYGPAHGLLTRYVKLQLRMHRECRERFPPPPISKETDSWRSRHASRHVRDARAVMHVGIAHLRWRGKRSRHSRRMCTRNFTYLARGPCAGPFGPLSWDCGNTGHNGKWTLLHNTLVWPYGPQHT